MTATSLRWKREGSGEWVGKCKGEVECRIVEWVWCGESTFATTITTPWRHPFSLPDRNTLTEAMTGFEQWAESAKIIVETRQATEWT